MKNLLWLCIEEGENVERYGDTGEGRIPFSSCFALDLLRIDLMYFIFLPYFVYIFFSALFCRWFERRAVLSCCCMPSQTRKQDLVCSRSSN